MRRLWAFLVLFGLAVLLLAFGKTTGPSWLVDASLVVFGLVAAWVILLGISRSIDFETSIITGERRKDR